MPDLEQDDGPDIEMAPLDERGTRLRSLFIHDFDKCSCRTETIDINLSTPVLYVGEEGIQVAPQGDWRFKVPLRKEPLTTQDFEALFIEAAKLAEDTPLEARDLDEAVRLVPDGSELEGIPVRGLPFPIAIPEQQYLGMYIQNYARCGAFLQVHSVQRLTVTP